MLPTHRNQAMERRVNNMNAGRIVSIFMLLMAASFIMLPAAAAQPPASLKIEFSVADTVIPNAEFDIFIVGDFDLEHGAFILTDVFADEFSTEGVIGSDKWDELALSMKDFVDENGISPLASGLTDNSGRVSFSGLSRGLYLVIGRDAEYAGSTYYSLPFLVALPSWDESAAEWIYDVEAKPKPGVITPTQSPEPTLTPTPKPIATPLPTNTPKPTPRPSQPAQPTPTPKPLPQTGMLWEPVFWLIGIGVLLIIIGAALRLVRKK